MNIRIGDRLLSKDGLIGRVILVENSEYTMGYSHPYKVACENGRFSEYWFHKDSMKLTPLLEVLL